MNELILKVSTKIQKNNLPEFKQSMIDYIESINTDLNTEDDFAEAESAVKTLKEAEDALAAAKERIFDSGDLKELNDTIIELQDKFKNTRLPLANKVKVEKQRMKDEMVNKAHQAVQNAAADAVYSRHIKVPDRSEFVDQIKGKRNATSMQEALNNFVGVQIQDIATQTNKINKRVKLINQLIEGHEHLFNIDYLISFEGDVDVHIKQVVAENQKRIDEAAAIANQKAKTAVPADQVEKRPAPPQQSYSGGVRASYCVRVKIYSTEEDAKSLATYLANRYGRDMVTLTIIHDSEVSK